VEAQLGQVSNTIQGMSTNLTDAQTVINHYIAVTTQLKTNVETAQLNAPTWITSITLILSLVLGWLVIAQLGLGMQGFDLVRGSREKN
jgi:hypothetical protein